MAVDGIEACDKAIREGSQCMCGLMPELLVALDTDEGTRPDQKCRLCTGISEHHYYGLTHLGRPWGIEVCGVCELICNEF